MSSRASSIQGSTQGTTAGGPAHSVAELSELPLSVLDKSMPEEAAGRTAGEFLASGPRLSAFGTPLLVLSSSRMDANVAQMAKWCADRGVEIAPHGKTTMAPALWERQLRAGAWGVSLATMSQVRVALSFGVKRIQLANALVDPVALAWACRELDLRPDVTLLVWADSPETVAAMNGTLASLAPRRPLPVLVELGAGGGRTGARGIDAALGVAEAVRRSEHLHLSGVSGYEGALAHDGSEKSVSVVRGYLSDLAELHRRLVAADAYQGTDEVVVTAGGSAYFDDVADVLGGLRDDGASSGLKVRVMLRSGAYIIHDDGFYRMISPFSRGAGEPLRSAMHAWSRVVSRPEPSLALLDVGKRDVPFDEGLPEAQLVADRLGAPARPLTGAQITEVNDQHAFLRIPPDSDLGVGQVVRLGLSHPCTAFDKWRWIPVVGDDDAADPVVVDLVRTFF
jgi:D-serine deaminase-like pyridoxal phosphate-dependent protein